VGDLNPINIPIVIWGVDFGLHPIPNPLLISQVTLVYIINLITVYMPKLN